MSMIDWAKKELDLIGLTDKDEMNAAMRKHILHMVDEFSKEGHSGFSAAYAAQILEKILRYEPLSALHGGDDEWNDVTHYHGDGGTLYQNKRCSHVFKDDNGAYDIDGKIFVEHYYDDEGIERTHAYTSKDSRVPVTFPYTPEREYVDVGFRKE